MSDLCRSFGLTLDPWQELVLQDAMGERSDGTWSAKRVGLSAPRQNGKSQLIVARALAGALLFGERKIVISAHQQDTARETFAKFLELRDESPLLAEYMPERLTMNALNRESIGFANGAKIQFKARAASGGRGFSSDCLLLDEAQILKRRAWASINSTMSARPNPQIWLLGTPPEFEGAPEDSEVFESVRRSALDGATSQAAWLEWSAEPGDDPASEETRAKANPAWHTRINHDVVQGEFETYDPKQFAIERLGRWDLAADKSTRLIPRETWERCAVDEPLDGTRSLAIVFSFDGQRQAVAVAAKHDEGYYAELVGQHSGDTDAGTQSLVRWLASDPARPERWRALAEVVIAGGGEAATLLSALVEAGVPKRMLRILSTREVLSANATLLDLLREGSFSHPRGPANDALDASVAVCDQKTRPSGWSWRPTTPDGDQLPIEAVCMATWTAKTTKRRPIGDQQPASPTARAGRRVASRGRRAGRR